MTTITPKSKDNKGRFNLRTITILEDKYNSRRANVLYGVTDTNKEVAILTSVRDIDKHNFPKTEIAIQYNKSDLAGWINWYTVSEEEGEYIYNLAKKFLTEYGFI